MLCYPQGKKFGEMFLPRLFKRFRWSQRIWQSCDFSVTPSPNWTFGFRIGISFIIDEDVSSRKKSPSFAARDCRGLDLGLGLDNYLSFILLIRCVCLHLFEILLILLVFLEGDKVQYIKILLSRTVSFMLYLRNHLLLSFKLKVIKNYKSHRD